jgi:chromate transport protein ChrA
LRPGAARAARDRLLGWAFFTGLLVALGNVLLPTISRPVTPLVVVALAALTAGAVALLTLDYFRRAKRDDATVALTFGVCLASIGLTLDAVLLLSTDFRYPNVDEQRTATLAVLLLLGYALAAVVPVLVASLRTARR